MQIYIVGLAYRAEGDQTNMLRGCVQIETDYTHTCTCIVHMCKMYFYFRFWTENEILVLLHIHTCIPCVKCVSDFGLDVWHCYVQCYSTS